MSTDWERQRAFRAVLQAGSLSGAARVLGVAQPTVRRRIAELEDALGTALFTRAPGGLIPTDHARTLATHAEAMALAADAFVRAGSAAPDAIAGTVRISASEVVAVEVLPPALAALMRRHPRLAIELSPSNRQEDVLRRAADVAVRMAAPQQEALVAQHVGAISLALFARDDYLAKYGIPQGFDDVAGHCLIGVETDNVVLDAMRAQGLALRLHDFAFRTDHQLAQLAALRAGTGIGVAQIRLAARDPRLVRVLPDFRYDMDTWIVCHEDQRSVARVRIVFDALVEAMRGYIRDGVSA